ncbi:hypothetical protein C6A37_02845 [Desulfobacteraceae bacterium SEEP-SAG9]|nr:hypothetical protein C6A37_02845 [Desulfobacteraceae bacterium SEEP-SAG9]
MIRWTRTAQIARGKHQEAIQWAKDTREYTKTKFEGGADVKIFLETLGDFGVICWMVDFENLAMLELASQVLDEDSGYQERLQAASELFMEGTFDKVYSSVD